MKKTTKTKLISKAIRGSSAALAAGVPIWLIAQKFPLWVVQQESEVALTGGGIAVAIVAIMSFRKKLFGAVKPALQKMRSMGGVALGTTILAAAILGVCCLVEKVYPILPDIQTICMGGVVSGMASVGLDVAAMTMTAKNSTENTTTEGSML